MTKINVGLLGFGLAGAVFHAPLILSCPDMRLRAIGSRTFTGKTAPDGVRTAAIDEVIGDPDIDLIVVATPNASHAALAAAALEAGKHVVVDKPVAIRLSDAERLIDIASRNGRMLSAFQNRRWDSGFQTARNVLSEGVLGEISYAEFHFDRFRPEVKSRWREDRVPGGGLLYDLGPHLIDQAYCLFGAPDSVFADVAAQRQGARAVDYFHVVLTYDRRRVILHATSLATSFAPEIALYGDRGDFRYFGLDSQEEALRGGVRPGDADWGDASGAHATLRLHGGEERPVEPLRGAYETYYSGVAKAILTGAAPPVTDADIRSTMAILDAAFRSGGEKRAIALF